MVADITAYILPLPNKFIIKVPTKVAINTFNKFPRSNNVPKNFSFSCNVFTIAVALLFPSSDKCFILTLFTAITAASDALINALPSNAITIIIMIIIISTIKFYN